MLVTLSDLAESALAAPPSDVWSVIPAQPRLLFMKTVALHAASWPLSAFKMPLLVRPDPTTRTPQVYP